MSKTVPDAASSSHEKTHMPHKTLTKNKLDYRFRLCSPVLQKLPTGKICSENVKSYVNQCLKKHCSHRTSKVATCRQFLSFEVKEQLASVIKPYRIDALEQTETLYKPLNTIND